MGRGEIYFRAEALKFSEKSLLSTKFNVSFPDDGPSRILRRAILGCYPYTGCSFVLMTPTSVFSVK
jgi:hypothetical protein